MVSRPCALGLVGLVCLLIGNGFAMMCLNLACLAAACEECMFEHENIEHEERTHPLTLGLVLHGHTCLPRVHTTVQCLTKFKGTSKNVFPVVSVQLTLGLVLCLFDLPLVLCCMGTHICRAFIPQCNA